MALASQQPLSEVLSWTDELAVTVAQELDEQAAEMEEARSGE